MERKLRLLDGEDIAPPKGHVSNRLPWDLQLNGQVIGRVVECEEIRQPMSVRRVGEIGSPRSYYVAAQPEPITLSVSAVMMHTENLQAAFSSTFLETLETVRNHDMVSAVNRAQLQSFQTVQQDDNPDVCSVQAVYEVPAVQSAEILRGRHQGLSMGCNIANYNFCSFCGSGGPQTPVCDHLAGDEP